MPKEYVIDNERLMSEWDWSKNQIYDPKKISHGSAKKVWWKCTVCGNEWQAAVNKRFMGRGCPKCSRKRATTLIEKKALIRTGSLFDAKLPFVSEWHPTKNGNLTPHDVTPSSGKKVWWKCEKGHEYESPVYVRKAGMGCPYCSGRDVIVGINDLKTTHPEIAEQWHPTKNGELKPEDFKSGSDKVVWWKCEKGHEWKTNIYHRLKTGCPVCMKEKFTSFPEQTIFYYLKKAFHDVINRYMLDDNVEIDVYLPRYSLAIEYDGAKFHNNAAGYDRDKRKYEILKNKNIYLIRVKEAMQNGYISDTADAYIGYEDNKNNRNLEHILDDLRKLLVKKLGIKIQWDVNISRDRRDIYRQYMGAEKENNIAILYPHLIDEWVDEKNFPINPYMVTKGSEKEFWWKCSKGHEYKAKVKARVRNGCPYCSNNKVLIGFNDLATRYPNLAKEWIVEKNGGINPNTIIGGKQNVWWRCSKGHEWQATIDSRKQGRGCPVCSGKKIIKGYNDLATTNPVLVNEWNYDKNGGVLPTAVGQGSGKKVWWRCELGHEWEATVASRVRGAGCPYCANQKVLVGFNDLQTRYPKVAEEWNYNKNEELLPTEVVPGSTRKVWWKCSVCGHEWQAPINNRSKGSGCPVCKRRRDMLG